MTTTKTYSTLIILAVILALFVVGLGAFTRLTHAGLGCPDWPGCYGEIVVPSAQTAEAHSPEQTFDTQKAWTEMVHRYFAGALVMLILAIVIYSGLHRREQYPLKLPIFILIFVGFQAALGMWTVTLKLQPTIVMAHLLGGLTTLSLLWLLWLRARTHSATYIPVSKGLRTLGMITLLVLIVQLALGGWTSANYAGVACPSFPHCMGDSWLGNSDFSSALQLWLPLGPNYEFGALDNPARQGINVLHRLGALAVTLFLSIWCIWILVRLRELRFAATFTLLLLLVQLHLGMTNVLMNLPLHAAVTHNVIGALLLLAVVGLNYQLYLRRG